MNPRLDLLHPYPFERLRLLFSGIKPGGPEVNLGIGEPQHPTPILIKEALIAAMPLLAKYPPTMGTTALREAISKWSGRRYGVPLDPDREILPVAGSREALFAFAQAILDPADPGIVLLPNPFYQIYEGAAIMAGATPVYVPTPASNGFLPDWSAVPAEVWPRVKLVYLCSPGNPTGAVLELEEWKEVFDLADRYGFVVASDECYSEIFTETPPIGALQAAKRLGRTDQRLIVFNSLSKRSSAPGLRSGFVAGDAEIIQRFLLYRTYHGCAPGLQIQAASAVAWNDEEHVEQNRAAYRAKFIDASGLDSEAFVPRTPAGGFFLWLSLDGAERDDEAFALGLYRETGITVLPGSYLGRSIDGANPGSGYVRVALVPEREVCRAALERIRDYANRSLA